MCDCLWEYLGNVDIADESIVYQKYNSEEKEENVEERLIVMAFQPILVILCQEVSRNTEHLHLHFGFRYFSRVFCLFYFGFSTQSYQIQIIFKHIYLTH